jgi:hypothetical protein
MKESSISISAQQLREFLSYCPETGIFTWRTNGAHAGYVERNGYRRIKVKQRIYSAHRLAWYYMTGEWPSVCIDHINGERGDNRFSNLRKADDSQSIWNRNVGRKSRTGHKGVYKNPHSHGWIARIGHRGRTLNLGTYPTPEEAAAVFRVHEAALRGEFVRNANNRSAA